MMRDYESALKQAKTCANRKYCDIGGNCEYYDLDVCCQGGEKDILNDAADAIEELLAAVPKWVSVEERLPEDEQWLLVWGHGQKIPTMMFRESGAWIDDQFEFHTTITHWMPLPKPPKEVE